MEEPNQAITPIDIIDETLEKVKKIKDSRKIENLRIQTNLIVPLCEALATTLEQLSLLSEQISAISRDFGAKIATDDPPTGVGEVENTENTEKDAPKRGRKPKNTEKTDDQAPSTDSNTLF